MKKKKKEKWYQKVYNQFFDHSEDDFHPKSSFSVLEVIFLILISLVLGIVTGYFITKGNPSYIKSSHAAEIITTYNDILDNYYGDIDEETLADEAIKGMINSLEDPYSNYLDRDIATSFKEKIDGSFTGIGIQVVEEDPYPQVIKVFDHSPAAQAGIQVDDYIIQVDGKKVNDSSKESLTDLIKGKEGSKVKITILRDDEEKEITVIRDQVELDTVMSDFFVEGSNKIGYLKILTFSSNTADQFSSQLKKLENKEMDSLIIDVRDNPGGHLKQTREILSLFFNKKTVLYQIETKNKQQKIYSKSNDQRTYPVVILINENTASASEILASCFQEKYKNCEVVGETSFGKGTVQKSENLSGGSTIKYTTQKWLTSSGKWLNHKGVVPDHKVSLLSEDEQDFFDEEDNQLQEAIQILKKESN